MRDGGLCVTAQTAGRLLPNVAFATGRLDAESIPGRPCVAKPSEKPINAEDTLMKTKDEYIESLACELKEWNAQIDLLTAKAEVAAEHARLQYAEEIEALRVKHRAASEKMRELQEESGEAWEAAKESADKIWAEFRVGLDKVIASFK
jgi:dGTP triphosphohydrolase